MDNLTVARFFGHLWPSYCKDGLEIELLKFWHTPPHASPFLAAVVWDRDKWAILADEGQEPRTLFGQLFHELEHVRAGDVTKDGYGREVLKQAATGAMYTATRKSEITQDVAASRAEPGGRLREKLADLWAEVEARKWWPVLVRLGEGASDEAMKAAISNHRG